LLWVAVAVCGARDRRKAAGVFEGLAISAGGVAMVGGEDAWEGLGSSGESIAAAQRRFDWRCLQLQWNSMPERLPRWLGLSDGQVKQVFRTLA